METQTWISRHFKFISAENITILTVSSDNFLHAFLEVAEPSRKAGKKSSVCVCVCVWFMIE